MLQVTFTAFILSQLALCASANRHETSPITKVLSLLSDLQSKIIKEGEVAQKEYASYADWCEDRARNLQFEIKTLTAQVEGLKATIDKEAAIATALGSKVEELAGGIAANEADLKAATAIRGKESEDFAAEEAELVGIVDTLGRAISILEKQARKKGAALVDVSHATNVVQALNVMVQASVFSAADAKRLTSLVQSSAQADEGDSDFGAPEAATYQVHAGSVIETLEGLLEKAEDQLASARKSEQSAAHNFEMLKQSLEDEIKFASKELEEAKEGIAASEQTKATASGDLEVTSKDLKEDVSFLADGHKLCSQTAADFEAAVKSRSEEIEALTQAKKAISEMTGGADQLTYGLDQVSFLQRAGSQLSSNVPHFAVVRLMRGLAKQQGSSSLSQLAERVASVLRTSWRSGQDPFAKVKQMVTDMIASLEDAAAADASHKAYCDKELAEATAKKTEKAAKIDKLSATVDSTNSRIAVLTGELAMLSKELSEIAKSQASYDQWFREYEDTYTTDKETLEAGVEGVKSALKVLREYYSESDTSHGAAEGAGSGIIGLLEIAESDFTKGLAEVVASYRGQKSAYDATTKENELSTTMKKADVKYKTKEVTSLTKALGEAKSDRAGVSAELDAVLEYLSKLTETCIAKAEPYSVKKARREAEIEGMKRALAVLEGEAVLLQQPKSRGDALLHASAKK